MADALKCDATGCDHYAAPPYLGWWHLTNASLLQVYGVKTRIDFCSWECLGAFVMQEAGTVADLQQRIDDLPA